MPKIAQYGFMRKYPVGKYHYSFPAMGSDCRLALYAAEERAADAASDCVMAETWRIEQKYSRHAGDNALAMLNRAAAAGSETEVDDETAELIGYALAAHKMSGGLFDISSGALNEAWNFNATALPDPSAIAAILARVGLDKIEWAPPRIKFTVPGMALDFGGLGKEYAVDRAAEICQRHGIEAGLIDFGGDLRTLGPHPDGSPWEIGIQHPRHPEVPIGMIRLARGAVATSGDYERYIEVNGQRYCHILNPQTGWPARGLASVTVMADRCLLAGTISTIAMLKEEAGKKWLAGTQLEYCWVDLDMQKGGNLPG